MWRRLSFAVASLAMIALAFALTAGNAKRPSKAAAFALAAEPESTLTALTDTSQQQFGNSLNDVSCGENQFNADPASTINVTVTADNGTNDVMVNLIYQGTIVQTRTAASGVCVLGLRHRGRRVHRAGLQVRQPTTPFMPAGRGPYTGIYADVDASARNPFSRQV